MAIKVLKPNTPGQRGMTTQDFDEITTKKPVKSLLTIQKGSVGRNNQGRITTRHRGGGVRRARHSLCGRAGRVVRPLEHGALCHH